MEFHYVIIFLRLHICQIGLFHCFGVCLLITANLPSAGAAFLFSRFNLLFEVLLGLVFLSCELENFERSEYFFCGVERVVGK